MRSDLTFGFVLLLLLGWKTNLPVDEIRKKGESGNLITYTNNSVIVSLGVVARTAIAEVHVVRVRTTNLRRRPKVIVGVN